LRSSHEETKAGKYKHGHATSQQGQSQANKESVRQLTVIWKY